MIEKKVVADLVFRHNISFTFPLRRGESRKILSSTGEQSYVCFSVVKYLSAG
jgi:hypothetical protein